MVAIFAVVEVSGETTSGEPFGKMVVVPMAEHRVDRVIISGADESSGGTQSGSGGFSRASIGRRMVLWWCPGRAKWSGGDSRGDAVCRLLWLE